MKKTTTYKRTARLLCTLLASVLVFTSAVVALADEDADDIVDNGYENGYEDDDYNGYDNGYENGYEDDYVGIVPISAEIDVVAVPSAHNVEIDGEAVAFRAFNINDNNFFMLRDIAAALNGSAAQFSVEWDDEAQAIQLTTGEAYDGEIAEVSDAPAEQVLPSTAVIYVDGELVDLTAFNIDGNNFFMLRDLADALGFEVDWDQDTATVLIITEIEDVIEDEDAYVDELVGELVGRYLIDLADFGMPMTFYLYIEADGTFAITTSGGDLRESGTVVVSPDGFTLVYDNDAQTRVDFTSIDDTLRFSGRLPIGVANVGSDEDGVYVIAVLVGDDHVSAPGGMPGGMGGMGGGMPGADDDDDEDEDE